MKKIKIWHPKYSITASITKALMEIQTAKTIVENTPLSPTVEAKLRYEARLRSTHFSTKIEGNQLTLKQAKDIIENKTKSIQQRQRDVNEVRNYWDALLKVELWAADKRSFSEELIRQIHGIVQNGLRSKPTDYRDGQNVIRDSASGGIVYLPPEAKDVSDLMSEMVNWVNTAFSDDIPVPIIASLVHYQFVTIHPYNDGNGRTARLLSTFILQRDGYGLNGFLSLEEHHARDLQGYYNFLAVGSHHNYYFGRETADLTTWVNYFIQLLAAVFSQAKDLALSFSNKPVPVENQLLKKLDHRQRIILALFADNNTITTAQVAKCLGISARMARNLVNKWVLEKWLFVANKANRIRSYGLSEVYRQFVGNLSEMDIKD